MIAVAKSLVNKRNLFQQKWGMDFHHDVVEWVGGYSYEFARAKEFIRFLDARQFRCLRTLPPTVPTGCNHFVFKNALLPEDGPQIYPPVAKNRKRLRRRILCRARRAERPGGLKTAYRRQPEGCGARNSNRRGRIRCDSQPPERQRPAQRDQANTTGFMKQARLFVEGPRG